MTYMYHDSREDFSPAANGFEKLLGELQPGDCMVVEQLSGAAKDAASLLKLLEDLEVRGIRFRSVEEDFDTGTEQGRFALNILRKVSQLDAGARREKQPEAGAKEDSRGKGRKPIEVNDDMFDAILERWKNGEITARQAMAELDLKPNTFYRRVKERMPDVKTPDTLLDAAKKLGQEIVNTVTEGSEELQQAAGKFAAECDISNLSDTVKKNITAAGKVFSRHMDSLSRDFQDAVEKYEKKQQEAAQAAEAPAAPAGPEVPAEPETSEEPPITEEACQAPSAEEAAPNPEETEYL